MRRLTALALLQSLILASPAFAMLGDDLDSEHQTQQYGHIFGGVLIAAAAAVVLFVVYYMYKTIRAEHSRGKKSSPFREEILDKMPRKQQTLFLGEKVPDWKLDNRKRATRAAIKFLACTDGSFASKRIAAISGDAFRTVKASVEARSLKKLERLATPEFLDRLQSEIKKLKKDSRLHVFGRLEVLEMVLVHFEAPAGKKNHNFTVLITAKSKDYFQDDESGELLRGDKKTYIYQEFLCFRRSKDRWLLDRIRPSGDMDRILEAKNVLAEIDLEEFSKDADPEFLREFVAR